MRVAETLEIDQRVELTHLQLWVSTMSVPKQWPPSLGFATWDKIFHGHCYPLGKLGKGVEMQDQISVPPLISRWAWPPRSRYATPKITEQTIPDP